VENRPESEIAWECEGIELFDDDSESSTIDADPISALQHAKSSYRQAWNRWFSSYLETTARKAEFAKLRIANRLASYVRGVPVWPVLVVYVVLVAGLFVLASTLPVDFSWLPLIIRIGLMGACKLIPFIILFL
jgi:hypothetical protein